MIDKIAHVSSVSGGSIAATYYVLKKPGHDIKVLNPDGTMSDGYRTFFETYRSDLSQDFEGSLIWRQLLSLRWVNSALAAKTAGRARLRFLRGSGAIPAPARTHAR